MAILFVPASPACLLLPVQLAAHSNELLSDLSDLSDVSDCNLRSKWYSAVRPVSGQSAVRVILPFPSSCVIFSSSGNSSLFREACKVISVAKSSLFICKPRAAALLIKVL